MFDVQASVRGVGQADENHLCALADKLIEAGADSPAVVFYPHEEEIGVTTQWHGTSIQEVEHQVREVLSTVGGTVFVLAKGQRHHHFFKNLGVIA